jgi:UDP-N-acetylmuramoyl-L-alanyl-D-glutamate--2,6-diaminopimelate ligase
MLHALKKMVPNALKQPYHYVLARVAEVKYGHPANEMLIIGVTGTNGKSSTVNFLAQLLQGVGEVVGYTSTAGFTIAGREIENRMKMTMPGRFVLQKLLRQMREAGCTVAIVETSSQGLAQFRHLGINYDIAVFTNLTPEHIEAHGGFENYKKAKGLLFQHLTARRRKTINGKRVPKVAVLNADDQHSAYYASFPADEHRYFGLGMLPGEGVRMEVVEARPEGARVLLNDVEAFIPFGAKYQWVNVLAAVAAAQAAGHSVERLAKVIEHIRPVPGRFEVIKAGQPFTVIVDYAYEPYALQALFEAIKPLQKARVIGVHGSAGGGRDVARRPVIGRAAGQVEDIVIITNEDPYDENPRSIMEQVAEGVRAVGKEPIVIEDRRAAIQRACEEAQVGDIVLITGKGSEPVMAVAGGKTIPWDDRAEVRAALRKLGYTDGV